MTDNPMELITKVVPDLFNGAVQDIRAAAEGGDEGARARLADIEAVAHAVHVRLEGDGGGDVYLVGKDGKLQPQESPPDVPVVIAIATPYEPLQILLEEEGDKMDQGFEKLRKRLSRASLGKALPFVSTLDFKFHNVILDTPDFDEVRTKIALGSSEIPERPTFTISFDYEVYEQLQAGKIKPQSLLSKLQLEGDSASFMQFVMDRMARAGQKK